MIEGIKIKNLTVNSDSPGSFIEILRDDEGLLRMISQISTSKTLPGVIKAFHWHKNQDDIFYILDGKINLVLYDPREDSPTRNETQNFVLDKDSKQVILIPRRVLHGYRVLGTSPAEVLYIMNNTYNPHNPDEQRVDFNDSKINYDWDLIK